MCSTVFFQPGLYVKNLFVFVYYSSLFCQSSAASGNPELTYRVDNYLCVTAQHDCDRFVQPDTRRTPGYVELALQCRPPVHFTPSPDCISLLNCFLAVHQHAVFEAQRTLLTISTYPGLLVVFSRDFASLCFLGFKLDISSTPALPVLTITPFNLIACVCALLPNSYWL